jgi:phosphohistidine phosphatase
MLGSARRDFDAGRKKLSHHAAHSPQPGKIAVRRLMLLRHAKAVPADGMDDEARPLNKRGRTAMPALGEFMAKQALLPDLALISTSVRTRETWELLLSAFAAPPPHRFEPRLYAASAEALLLLLRATEPSVRALLLIGHNPGFEEVARALVASGETQALIRYGGRMPTASLAVIDLAIDDWRGLQPQRGRLEHFVSPKSLGANED